MTADPPPASPDEERRPRVGLALPAGDVRARLLSSLERADVTVERIAPGSDAWRDLDDQEVDVLVVRKKQLTPELLQELQQRSQDDSIPDVVVVSSDEDPLERADLIASGVARVLDPEEGSSSMATELETLAEAAQEGGRDGPEGGGAAAQPKLADFLSRSPYMRRFLDVVRKVSDADASLLITGETGVGKERLARAIHAQSSRSDAPFVAVNCAALPEQLLESELFGHEAGAFTGATGRRKGRFEEAQGGTIFLDEVGEMPTHLQVKLLTVLQGRELQRLGGSKSIALDVRVMAATNRDVKREVAEGTFREDLYYRLAVVALEIPSLRERREDLPDLAGYLIAHYRRAQGDSDVEGITERALEALMAYDWPGNVRELINVIERATLLSPRSPITLESLPRELLEVYGRGGAPLPTTTAKPSVDGPPTDWSGLTIKAMREQIVSWAERRYLDGLLTATHGHIAETAKRAGIGPRALYDRMRRYELDKDDYKVE